LHQILFFLQIKRLLVNYVQFWVSSFGHFEN
jgi:hypothetical protein